MTPRRSSGLRQQSRERYFFDIAVYRVAEGLFQSQYEAAWARKKAGIDANYGGAAPQERLTYFEDYFWRAFGMPWRYNQVIGWIRLYVLGNQIRGELWRHQAKRYQRIIARRRYECEGKAFELYVYPEDSNKAIAERLREELLSFQNELGNGRFVLDLQCFDSLAPSIDWHLLMGMSE